MKNLQKAAMVAAVAGGLTVAGAGSAFANTVDAHGLATDSPGVVSGNVAQVPVHVPVNVVGDTVNVIGLLNPAFGDHAVNR